jgi:hypothetical protein
VVPPVHPDIEPIAFLLGTWSGSGRGEYPTIEPFTYVETVTFEHFGKPFVAYTQRTRGDAGPLHAESGYIRVVDDGSVEMTIAQPTGVAEIYSGTLAGTRLEFASAWIGRTPTAKRVDRVGRVLEVTDGVMRNELHMASVGQDYQWHLGAELRPV